MKLSAKEIQTRAMQTGHSMSWVDLLKSKQIADKVADKAWARLSGKGRKREHTVIVSKSESYAGTWSVRVMLPGVTLSSLVSGGQELDAMERKEGAAALSAAFSPDDLVTSWSR